MVLRRFIHSVDAGAGAIGHTLDHRSAGIHGGKPASDVNWVEACVCLTRVKKRRRRERTVPFAQMAVIPFGRGKRACCHMAGPRPATSPV